MSLRGRGLEPEVPDKRDISDNRVYTFVHQTRTSVYMSCLQIELLGAYRTQLHGTSSTASMIQLNPTCYISVIGSHTVCVRDKYNNLAHVIIEMLLKLLEEEF